MWSDSYETPCINPFPNRTHVYRLPQVDLLKIFMKDKLNKDDENWMRLCCLAMDTNAYEFLRVLDDGTILSLRGLYPLASIINHDCSPNTSHHYDRNGVMKVTSQYI